MPANVQPEETPSTHDLYGDANVTIASLPADEQAYVAEHFGWDEQESPEEIEAQFQAHLKAKADEAARIAEATLSIQPVRRAVRHLDPAAFSNVREAM